MRTPPENSAQQCAPMPHQHMGRCWQYGWEAGSETREERVEGIDEWSVRYLAPVHTTWVQAISEGFLNYEEAAAFAAIAPEGRVMHRRVTPWAEYDEGGSA